MDYIDRLRRLALNLADSEDDAGTDWLDPPLDPTTLTLVKLAALVAIGGAGPSYGALVDEALDNGATADEIVATLLGVLPIVALPRVVHAAPLVALALGHDIDDDVEQVTTSI